MVGAMIVYGILLAVGPSDYKILVHILRTVNLSEQQYKALFVLELPLLLDEFKTIIHRQNCACGAIRRLTVYLVGIVLCRICLATIRYGGTVLQSKLSNLFPVT